jgi:hypothetical protein
VRQLAITVDRWWPEIEAFLHTGHSNAKTKASTASLNSSPAPPSASATPTTNAYAHAA